MVAVILVALLRRLPDGWLVAVASRWSASVGGALALVVACAVVAPAASATACELPGKPQVASSGWRATIERGRDPRGVEHTRIVTCDRRSGERRVVFSAAATWRGVGSTGHYVAGLRLRGHRLAWIRHGAGDDAADAVGVVDLRRPKRGVRLYVVTYDDMERVLIGARGAVVMVGWNGIYRPGPGHRVVTVSEGEVAYGDPRLLDGGRTLRWQPDPEFDWFEFADLVPPRRDGYGCAARANWKRWPTSGRLVVTSRNGTFRACVKGSGRERTLFYRKSFDLFDDARVEGFALYRTWALATVVITDSGERSRRVALVDARSGRAGRGVTQLLASYHYELDHEFELPPASEIDNLVVTASGAPAWTITRDGHTDLFTVRRGLERLDAAPVGGLTDLRATREHWVGWMNAGQPRTADLRP